MTVSKAHDETSRESAAPSDEGATPAPTRDDAQSAKRAAAAAGARRARVGSAVARERSGPIGIASGDFSTPTVRRRTTTQPRGTPAVGIPLSVPFAPPPSVEEEAAPLPSPEVPPIGATPVDLVDGPSGQRAAPPPPSLDSPFVPPSTGALDAEAASLAAEAAAVRALDSGPLTPPPELSVPGPTPPPEPTVGQVVQSAAAAEEMAATPPPAAATDVEGALPMRPMGTDGSSASSDLANPIGVSAPTPAPAVTSDGDVELQGSDELVVDEGTDAGQADAAVATPTPPPRPTGIPTTPPPIPGSFLKTPGPELKPPPPAPVVEADTGHGPLLPALPILPEALSQRPRRPKRSKPWFEEVFDEDYLRTLPFMRADQTLREVEFISNALTAAPGSEILDVGCGYGRHAIELVQRGFNVTGLDLSLPLLIRAADEAQRRALSVNFVHADMREMAFEKQFDGAYSMLTSFGYFDEETNLRVAERIGRALKPGKRFLLDIVNRDYVVADLPVRVWWEGTGCVVLEEVDFNFHTSRINTHRSIVFEDGRQLEQELSVRAYSLHEIGRLLRQAGFRVIDVSGGLATRGDFFGSASRNLLIVAEKREDEG
jgi:SAM-dependent methyltransferase